MHDSPMFTLQQKLSRLLAAHGRGALWKHHTIAFISIIAFILIVHVIVLARGFASVSADDYARVLSAASWAAKPYIFTYEGIWLPGYAFIIGPVLKIYYDLFLIPHLIIFFFSFIALFMLYLLTKNLFNAQVALLAILIVGLLPFYVHLSLTPLADMIYFLLIIGFFYFFLVWHDYHQDKILLISAALLTIATTVRYEGWLVAACFCLYLGLRWLSAVRSTHALLPLWLLAMAMVCLFPCLWMLRCYLTSGHPLLFMAETFPGEPDTSGLLTSLSPKLTYIELLFQDGSLICLLAMGGLLLLRREWTQKLWIYLIFSLAPLILLTLFMRPPEFWAAYKPRYSGLFVILLTPFCAYALYWALTAHTQPVKYGWQTAGMALPIVVALYNLWLIYLRVEGQSTVWIFCLAFGSALLGFYLLERYDWIFFALSLVPLLAIMFVFNYLLAMHTPRSYMLWYGIVLFLFYMYFVAKYRRMVNHTSYKHWKIVGITMLSTVIIFNLFSDIRNVPLGEDSDIKIGWRIRKMFSNGTLTDDSKILVEVSLYNYLPMQVLSNHPANFILARLPTEGYGKDTAKSFLLDSNVSMQEIDHTLKEYLIQIDNEEMRYASDFNKFLMSKKIQLLIFKNPKIIALLNSHGTLKFIENIHGYTLYWVCPTFYTYGDLH